MSRTYEICCHDCKKTLWIGQGWPPRDSEQDKRYIYSTYEHIKAFRDFLFAHEFHRLEFGDDERLSNDEYEEMDHDIDKSDGVRR